MREVEGDIWSQLGSVEVIFITTNVGNNSTGRAVMGRGIALEAANRFPQIPEILGKINRSRTENLFPHKLWTAEGTEIWSFPTKGPGFYLENVQQRSRIISYMAHRFNVGDYVQSWALRSTLSMIETSAIRASKLAHESLALPRPGCGNGQLVWPEVHSLLNHHLDSRFTIYSL